MHTSRMFISIRGNVEKRCINAYLRLKDDPRQVLIGSISMAMAERDEQLFEDFKKMAGDYLSRQIKNSMAGIEPMLQTKIFEVKPHETN